MPRRCVVTGCTNRNKSCQDGIRLYNIPLVRMREGEETRLLTERRRRLWINAINRKDLTTESASRYRTVCSAHFITGKPAYMHHEHDPDWVPHLNLGYREDAADKDPGPALHVKEDREKSVFSDTAGQKRATDPGSEIKIEIPDYAVGTADSGQADNSRTDTSNDTQTEALYASYDLRPCSVKLERADDLLPDDQVVSIKEEVLMECDETTESSCNFRDEGYEMDTGNYSDAAPQTQSGHTQPSSESISSKDVQQSSEQCLPGIQYYKTDSQLIQCSAMNKLGTLSLEQLYLLLSVMCKEIMRLQAIICNDVSTVKDQHARSIPSQHEFKVSLKSSPCGVEIMHTETNNLLFRAWTKQGIPHSTTDTCSGAQTASDKSPFISQSHTAVAAHATPLASTPNEQKNIYAFTCGHICSVCNSNTASSDIQNRYGSVLPKVAVIPAPGISISSFDELYECSLEMTATDENIVGSENVNGKFEKVITSRVKTTKRQNDKCKGFKVGDAHTDVQLLERADNVAGNKSDPDDLPVFFASRNNGENGASRVSFQEPYGNSVQAFNRDSHQQPAATVTPSSLAPYTTKPITSAGITYTVRSAKEPTKIPSSALNRDTKIPPAAASLSNHWQHPTISIKSGDDNAGSGKSDLSWYHEQCQESQSIGTPPLRNITKEQAVARIDALLHMAEGRTQQVINNSNYNVVIGHLKATGSAEFHLKRGMSQYSSIRAKSGP